MSEKKETGNEIGKENKNRKKITKELLHGLAAQIKEKVEDIPLDGVFVKVMSGYERRMFHQKMADDKELDSNGVPITMIPVLIALCGVDEYGNNIFGVEPADIKEIDERIPSTVQNKIFGAAAKLNGLTEKAVDESVKN